jgi:acyl-CoA thioesterase I
MPNKKIIIGIFIVLILLLVFLFWPKKHEKVNIQNTSKIIAFGDSLVYGVGASKDKNFVYLLSKKIGVEIQNSGVSGNTTANGLARLDADVLSKKPDLVILLLGGNDALRQMPTEQTFGNLENIILQIKNSGSQVLLLGVRGGVAFLGKDYAPQFEKLAKKTNVVLVPDVLDGIFGKKNLMSDSIHPNEKGYEKIAEKVAGYIEVRQ